MNNWTLQRKWTYSAAISIFISFLAMCIILYFSIFNWMLISEKKIAQNTLNEVVGFFESRGPIISIQDIQRNKALLNQLVNQEQSVRILNSDGIEILRINDASDFPNFSSEVAFEFELQNINNKLLYHNTAEIDFGSFVGYLEISHSLQNFSQLMNYILIAMIIFALIALVLSAFIGYSLSSILLKPLKELRDEMQEANQYKFSKEITFQYTNNDEIGELLTIYKQLMNEVSETITKQDEFIHNVSHELRTPIQVVEGHLSLLNRWGKNDKTVLEESLEISLSEIQKMKKMIEEMLKLAKRENSNEVAKTDISKILFSIQKKYKSLKPEVTIIIASNLDEVLPVPQTALEQIIQNLIDNAIKYNENKPEIKIEVTKSNLYYMISIEDNGVGISQKHLPKIFERFYKVDASRTKIKGGSGLGLSIVNALVKEYKGIIKVESKEHEGTKFNILFPKMTNE